MKKEFICLVLLSMAFQLTAQKRVSMGVVSAPENSKVKLTLTARYQRFNAHPKKPNDFYDSDINSPKSALILSGKSKLYVNSLEGCQTPVYDLKTYQKIKVIKHKFGTTDSALFHEKSFSDYTFRTKPSNFNIFSGRPVEMCTSHNDKYLWIPYYRRSYDSNAIDPSAVAIIDTEKDEIVRVLPSAPLPKMIASSPNNKFVAVTNWGDNTVHIVDISSSNVNDFKYTNHFIVGQKMALNFSGKVNRDDNCGYCLRGTVFTPDSKYLLVGRMGGMGGIAVFDMTKMEYIGTVFGVKSNVRHLIIEGEYLYCSSNKFGLVQRTKLSNLIDFAINNPNSTKKYTDWKTVKSGIGARTIVSTSDGKYIFATANNESKVSIIQTDDMKVIGSINVDSYPVGMEINAQDNLLVVTSQGKKSGGGNSVMLFKIEYKN